MNLDSDTAHQSSGHIASARFSTVSSFGGWSSLYESSRPLLAAVSYSMRMPVGLCFCETDAVFVFFVVAAPQQRMIVSQGFCPKIRSCLRLVGVLCGTTSVRSVVRTLHAIWVNQRARVKRGSMGTCSFAHVVRMIHNSAVWYCKRSVICIVKLGIRVPNVHT